MSANRLIFSNIKITVVSQAVSLVGGMGTTIIIARALGAEGYGILGFGAAATAFLTTFMLFGTETHGPRQIARDRSRAAQIAGSLLGFRIFTGAIGLTVFLLLVSQLDRTEAEKNVLYVQAIGAFISVFTLDYLFHGLERFRVNAIRQISNVTLVFILVVILINDKDDVLLAALIYLGAAATCIGAIFIYTKLTIGISRADVTPGEWPVMMRTLTPVVVFSISQTIIIHTDTVMLGILEDNITTGHYAAVVKLALIALAPAGIVVTAFLPQLSAHHAAPEARTSTYRSFATVLILASIPFPAFAMIVPEQALVFLYGEEFRAGAWVLRMLMITVILTNLRMIMSTALVAWDSDKIFMTLLLLGAAANVGLNALLIPEFGGRGAATASALCNGGILLGLVFVFAKRSYYIAGSSHIVALCFSGVGVIVSVAARPFWLDTTILGGGPLVEMIIAGTIFAVFYVPLAIYLLRRDVPTTEPARTP